MVEVLANPNKFKKFVLDIGLRKSVSVFFVLLLVLGFGVTFWELNNRQEVRQHAATPVSNRILWQGQNWYVNGVNVPWYNWGCDFGCNSITNKSGGVSTNIPTLSPVLSQVQGKGLHVVRWWVFPGDAWQITRDANGAPSAINPAVYTDFDAALSMAQQYDLYYDFVLFSAPSHIPSTWQTDPTQRAKLAQVLGTLFAHYSGNPRILSWEPYNEPENDIWNGGFPQQPVIDTGTAIAASVHSNSPGTLVTIGSLVADGMKLWLNAGLDYYSPHWYDYMSSGDYCMMCHNYAYYSTWGVNKPIVIGEYYSGTSTTTPYSSSTRLNYWYNNGYAGAWAWSLFPSRTSDNLAIDMNAEGTFNTSHTDIGPIVGSVQTPTPTPTSTVTATPTPTPLVPTNTPTPTPTRTPTPTLAPTATPTPTSPPPTSTPTPVKLTGDINGDGKVNVQDLSYLLAPLHWQTNDALADLNHNGIVDLFDLSIMLSNWKP